MSNGDEILVEVRGVSKKFSRNLKRSLVYGLQDIAQSFFGLGKESNRLRKSEFWAVKDVSFQLRRGECLGLIGHNGAGKSTLLKMLNGLIRPDEGEIIMRGRIGALIELGAGFNPVLTGRENIYINGQVLGFSKKEINTKMEKIIEFAEIADFIDTPVQNYSSGMKVRLGFAVAAQMEPDVLLIDEVLAVGDMRFVIKCFNKMDHLMQNTALILVSHSMPQIARMASHVLLMSAGKSFMQASDVSTGIGAYYSLHSTAVTNFQSDGDVVLKNVQLYSAKSGWLSDNNPLEITGEEGFTIRMFFSLRTPIIGASIYLVFYDAEQRGFAEVMNFPRESYKNRCNGDFGFDATFDALPLSQGKYSITIAFSSDNNGLKTTHFRIQNCAQIIVKSKLHGWTPIHFEPEWNFLNDIKHDK